VALDRLPALGSRQMLAWEAKRVRLPEQRALAVKQGCRAQERALATEERALATEERALATEDQRAEVQPVLAPPEGVIVSFAP